MNDDTDTLEDARKQARTIASPTVVGGAGKEIPGAPPGDGHQSAVGGSNSEPFATQQNPPPIDDKPSHVVGIGASAGGLPALQAIFEGIPPDTGAAFVVVQHLSPNFNTLMDELIARHSPMTVKLADDGEYLRRNQVYVMRPCLLYTSPSPRDRG